MKRNKFFSVVSVLFLLVPASITRAQTISAQKGLTTALFDLPQGTIKVYLPENIRPGEINSGRILAGPVGNNKKQIEKNLAELKKYSVSINNEKIPVDNINKSFLFLVNSGGQRTVPMELINVSGLKAGVLAIPIMTEKGQQPAPGPCRIPSHAQTGSPLLITGSFNGKASDTKCELDGNPLEVLAESQSLCIVSFPAGVTGIKTLNVQENEKQSCSQGVSSVQMNVSAGKLDLMKRENTFIDVNITGLQNLPDTALLTLANLSTDVVAMLPSNNITIVFAPDSVGTGTFNKRFEIQSIKTGSFSVNVNLDLPETSTGTTGGQPENIRNSCECIAKVSLSLASSKPGEKKYSATVIAECKGVYGSGVNTFVQCSVEKTILKWSISEGKDNAEIVGDAAGASVTIKEKNNKPYTVKVTLIVTCSGGGTCEDSDEIAVVPTTTTTTTTEKVKCKCECSATAFIIKSTDKDGNSSFSAFIRGGCAPAPCPENGIPVICTPVKTIYDWEITAGQGGAKIVGKNNGAGVSVKSTGGGSYEITLTGKIICADGTECPFRAQDREDAPSKECIFDSAEYMEPKMDGGLKLDDINLNTKSAFRIINRDEYIALSAEGLDFDQLEWTCTPQGGCKEDATKKRIPLNGNVRFEWEIFEGDGSFVKLGCLPKAAKNEKGDNVIFKPPFVKLPVSDQVPEILTTKIHLSIIDDNLTQPIDPTVDDTITITTKRRFNSPDEYIVEIKDLKKHKKPERPPPVPAPDKGCVAKNNWGAKDQLATPVIHLPGVKDNNKMVLGQWIILNADLWDMDLNQARRDIDTLHIYCDSHNECPTSGAEKKCQDRVQFDWTQSNKDFPTALGVFISGKTGNYIIYQAPLKLPVDEKTKKPLTNMLTIKLKVKASNPDAEKCPDDDSKEGEITLEIYQPGVQLSYPPTTWLPTPDEKLFADLKSELMYRDRNDIWLPALAHMSRIHFIELMDVSAEKGICMNDPLPGGANEECRDLFLKKEGGIESFDGKPDPDTKCTLKELYQHARTRESEKECSIKLYSLDYGSYGFMRSFANTGKDISLEKSVYLSIPWTDKTVQHLQPDPVQRVKKEHEDNRVTIPYDIDENHIADIGWPKADNPKVQLPDPLSNNVDEDDSPEGDKTNGDGLSTYEEYRGLMVQEGTHVRTNPQIKTIFIRNKNDLPIDLYKSISMLEVFELSDSRYYQSDEERVVNFNAPPVVIGAPPSTHLVNQKGLFLIDGGTHGKLLGEGFSLFFKDNNGSEYDKQRPAPPNWELVIKIYVKTIGDFYKEPLKKAEKSASDMAAAKKAEAAKEKDPVKKKQALDEADELEKLAKYYKESFIPEKKAAVVAHELLHGNNVCHHGEVDPKSPNNFNNPGGLRSGKVSCVMHYDNIIENDLKAGKMEAIGSSLCKSSAGTGINANGKNCGDATNGNCASQLRISGVEPIPQACPPK